MVSFGIDHFIPLKVSEVEDGKVLMIKDPKALPMESVWNDLEIIQDNPLNALLVMAQHKGRV